MLHKKWVIKIEITGYKYYFFFGFVQGSRLQVYIFFHSLSFSLKKEWGKQTRRPQWLGSTVVDLCRLQAKCNSNCNLDVFVHHSKNQAIFSRAVKAAIGISICIVLTQGDCREETRRSYEITYFSLKWAFWAARQVMKKNLWL